MVDRVNIRGLSFRLLDDELRDSMAVMTTTTASKSGAGHIGTIYDPRLGTITPGTLCSTCSGTPEVCNGHCGQIALAEPVVSALFLPVLIKILNSICIACGAILVDLTDVQRTRLCALASRKRLTDLCNRSLKVRGPCSECVATQPCKWILVDNIIPRPLWSTDASVDLPVVTPLHVSLLLGLIRPSDAHLFGFRGSTPASIYMSSFLVPPTMIRPHKTGRAEDDLSIRLHAITTASVQLQTQGTCTNLSQWDDLSEGMVCPPDWKPRHLRNKRVLVPAHLEAYYDLQRHCAGFQDAKYCPKNDLDYGRDLTSVRHRFAATRHKRGRIRANILGKRGDYTARAVASPNTYIDPHEVGVPIQVCRHLTVREHVCAFNFRHMQHLVAQGPDQYPGATYVERDTDRFRLPFFRGSLRLGDVVHRHLRRGDTVIMNRQPSLHRFSMMGYRVVPMDCTTFQLHLSVTAAHNLDFDGDEVNLFVPGSVEAVAEINELMSVHVNLFKDGQLLVGFVQHACLAAYLMTRTIGLQMPRDTLLPAGQTGRELMRTLLPTYDGTFTVTKAVLNRLAAQHIAALPGHDMTRAKWIGHVVRTLEEFLIWHGSTLTYADCVSNCRDRSLIDRSVAVASADASEATCVAVVDGIRSAIGANVYKDLASRRPKNHLLDIVESGAKGNRSHIVQNVGMVGQQFNVHSDRHAALTSHAVTPAEQRGFVRSSFSDGLGPVEFFHHLASARIGLIGTAVSTAETGYCYRRISKCLEDVRVAFDHSVRTASGRVVTMCGYMDMESQYPVSNQLLSPVVFTCPEERDRIAECPRHSQDHMLPFAVDTLPPMVVPADTTAIAPVDIFHGVCALWARLSDRYMPPQYERIVFCSLSAHRLYHTGGVHTQEHLDRILTHVEETMCRALYAPGTPIGLVAAQSFSEPLTQMQLNRFHQSGEGSGLVSGVARIKEIINCVRAIQTPSMTIVFKPGRTLVRLQSVCIADVLSHWMLRGRTVVLTLDREIMGRHRITPRLVAAVIDATTSFTEDLTSRVWEVHLEDTASSSPVDARNLVKALLRTNARIVGIMGLHGCRESTVMGTDGLVRPCLVTRGSNLLAVSQLECVDVVHTTTNDIMQISDVHGIDAACMAIESTLLHVMSSNSADVDRKYIRIISREMCRTGTPCPLTFNGLSASNTSTLKLATFERSLDSFTAAAQMGYTDDLRGVSESVIVGKPVSVGTGGDFKLLLVSPSPTRKKRRTGCPSVLAKTTTKKRRRRHPQEEQHQRRAKTPPTAATASNPFVGSDGLFVPYAMECDHS